MLLHIVHACASFHLVGCFCWLRGNWTFTFALVSPCYVKECALITVSSKVNLNRPFIDRLTFRKFQSHLNTAKMPRGWSLKLSTTPTWKRQKVSKRRSVKTMPTPNCPRKKEKLFFIGLKKPSSIRFRFLFDRCGEHRSVLMCPFTLLKLIPPFFNKSIFCRSYGSFTLQETFHMLLI